MERAPEQNERAARIAALNDEFRQTPGGEMYVTIGVRALRSFPFILGRVRTFNDFNEDNDPNGWHDFGIVEMAGDKAYFKFDFMQPDSEYFCEPDKPECRRILTVLTPDEY